LRSQDELAETQIADPGYAGTNYEINVDGYDFELFDFWNDLEYVDNAYWDNVSVPIRRFDAHGNKGLSRGLKASTKRVRSRDKSGSSIRGYDPISYRSRAERDHYAAKASPMISSRTPAYALLPDWRVRLAKEPERQRLGSTIPVLPDVADVDSDSGTHSDMDDDDEEADGGLQIDPEMLKAILKEKLGQAGLEGLDEGAFMETISKLMSGDENAADGLANSLLVNMSNDAGGGALSSWLTGQGVSLEDDEEADDNASSATATTQTVSEAHDVASQSHIQQPRRTNLGKRASEDDANLEVAPKRPRGLGHDREATFAPNDTVNLMDPNANEPHQEAQYSAIPPPASARGAASRKSARAQTKRKS
jgi:hypothetical protein